MAIEKPVWIGLLKFKSKSGTDQILKHQYTSSKFKLMQDLPKGEYDVAFLIGVKLLKMEHQRLL